MSTTNTNKRNFLKTLMMSFAFMSFGGLTSLFTSPKSTKLGSTNNGFGGRGYGM
jgi:hypothetical protein